MKLSKGQPTEAARAIRPRLRELIGEADGRAVEEQLDLLLARGEQGAEIKADIQSLLGQRDETRIWLQVFQETGAPPLTVRGFEPIPGKDHTRPKPGTKFICPECGYEWFRPFFTYPVPTCPNDGKDLVKAP